LAEQDVQLTFMISFGWPAAERARGLPAIVKKYHESIVVAKPAHLK
jgi:hypothetical protein